MPTYLYLCEVHDEEFEEFHSITTKLIECSICKDKGLKSHEPKRLINCTSKGVVELSGQDLVDKVKNDAKQLKKDISKNSNLYANVLGESKYQELQTRIDKQKRG